MSKQVRLQEMVTSLRQLKSALERIQRRKALDEGIIGDMVDKWVAGVDSFMKLEKRLRFKADSATGLYWYTQREYRDLYADAYKDLRPAELLDSLDDIISKDLHKLRKELDADVKKWVNEAHKAIIKKVRDRPILEKELVQEVVDKFAKLAYKKATSQERGINDRLQFLPFDSTKKEIWNPKKSPALLPGGRRRPKRPPRVPHPGTFFGRHR